MRYAIWAATAAIVVLTIVSAGLNGWAWLTISFALVALAVSSEVLGAVFAMFLAKTTGREKGRRLVLAALLAGCVAFNGWSGTRAMGSLMHVETADHRPVADIERDLGRAVAALDVVENIDLADPASVKAAQTALVRTGHYTGSVDGLPGTGTTAALAAAGKDYRAERDRAERELGDARKASRTELVETTRHALLIVLIEAIKALGLWAIGVHAAGGGRRPVEDADDAPNVVPIRPYLRNGRLVTGHTRRPRGSYGSR